MAGSFQSASVFTRPLLCSSPVPPKPLLKTLVLGCRAHRIIQDNLLVKSFIRPAGTFSPIRLCSQVLEVRVWTWLFFGGGGGGCGGDVSSVNPLQQVRGRTNLTSVSVYSKDPSFAAWIFISSLLCVLFISGFSLRHFNFGGIPLGFLIGTVILHPSFEGLFLQPLLTPPQTCPPKSVHPNLPTPEQKPQTLFPGGGGGLGVLPGTRLLSASLDVGWPRTQGKRTKWVPAEKTAHLRLGPEQRGRSSRLQTRAVQLLFSFVF